VSEPPQPPEIQTAEQLLHKQLSKLIVIEEGAAAGVQ